jgi:PAS domain-containing protein
MTSLPSATGWSEQVLLPPDAGFSQSNIGNPSVEDEQFLLRAFRSFAEAAASLEQSYGRSCAEVERLRRELEKSNSDLAESLEENRGMRAHLDRILEGLPCRVVVVASDGQISRANPEALRLVGFNPNGDAPASGSVATLPSALPRLLECAQGRRRTGAERPGRGRRNALAGRAMPPLPTARPVPRSLFCEM